MTDKIIATCALSFYGIISIAAIIFWFVQVKRKTNIYFVISMALFGLGGGIITVPLLYDNLIISGIGRDIISVTGGAAMSFAPLVLISAIVLWVKEKRSYMPNKPIKVNRDEFVHFYNKK